MIYQIFETIDTDFDEQLSGYLITDDWHLSFFDRKAMLIVPEDKIDDQETEVVFDDPILKALSQKFVRTKQSLPWINFIRPKDLTVSGDPYPVLMERLPSRISNLILDSQRDFFCTTSYQEAGKYQFDYCRRIDGRLINTRCQLG